MIKPTAVAAVLATVLALPDFAAGAQHKPEATSPSTSQSALSEGEVRRVDKETKKITLRHGPLVNLDMPAMTMVFQVQDVGMVDQVKVGDKVKFMAEKIQGVYIITKLEVAQ
jgi:Cu/Ag efflux protein CusF